MVYIILGTGFEDMEAVAVFDVLKRGGADVQYAGIGSRTIESAHGMKVEADCLVTEIDFDIAEMVVIPGGLGGVCAIESSPEAKTAILIAHAKEIELGAICAGPRVLAGLNLLEGKTAVCYPGMEDQMSGANMTQVSPTQRDGRITTGRGPGACIDFGLRLLEVLKGEDAANRVAAEMHYAR